MSWINAFLKNFAGLTTVDYGLLVLGIAGMVIAAMTLVYPELNMNFIPN